MRTALVLFLCRLCCLAGTEPRKTVLEYPVYVSMAHGDVGAEFYGRAYDNAGGSFFAPNYLIIEVALFPARGPVQQLAPGDFHLRLNGATREWSAVTPGTVAGAIRNPGLDETRPGIVAGGGAGPGIIVMGGPRTVERFPGDPQARGPNRPQTGEKERPSSVETGAEAALKFALDPVPAGVPGASGLVYFYWKGKLKDLKKIELIYDGPAGRGTLRLR